MSEALSYLKGKLDACMEVKQDIDGDINIAVHYLDHKINQLKESIKKQNDGDDYELRHGRSMFDSKNWKDEPWETHRDWCNDSDCPRCLVGKIKNSKHW